MDDNNDNNDTSHSGVVDPALLDADTNGQVVTVDAGDIPAFLRRDANGVLQAPTVSFATEVNEETGQTEIVIENGDAALEVLNALPEQEIAEVQHDNAAADNMERVTAEGNDQQWPVPEGVRAASEALISNAPSEQAKVNNEETEDEGNEAPPAHGSNQPANPEEMRRDFFKDINKFGKASGEGASALGRLGLRALRAAADGVISTAKPQGGGKDDATLIYETYTASDSKHSEHTAGGAKANASKLRQIIGMGCMTTLSDPVAVGDRVVRIHEEMTDADLKPKALFAALVDVAREQQASDTELTDAAIAAALTKTKADKTIEKEWEAIHKRVEGLVTGEASHGLKDQSDTAIKIQELVSERLKQYKSDGTRADRIEMMVENGYTEAQAIAIVDKKISV